MKLLGLASCGVGLALGNAAWLREKLTSAASVDVRILAGEDPFLPWRRETDVRHAVAELVGRPAS